MMEWSVLAGQPTGITVFFIDEGIDTGNPILYRVEHVIRRPSSIGEAKQSLFCRDGFAYAEALRAALSEQSPQWRNQGGRRYYVMSRLLSEVVSVLLATPSESQSVPSQV